MVTLLLLYSCLYYLSITGSLSKTLTIDFWPACVLCIVYMQACTSVYSLDFHRGFWSKYWNLNPENLLKTVGFLGVIANTAGRDALCLHLGFELCVCLHPRFELWALQFPCWHWRWQIFAACKQNITQLSENNRNTCNGPRTKGTHNCLYVHTCT